MFYAAQVSKTLKLYENNFFDTAKITDNGFCQEITRNWSKVKVPQRILLL